jgi:hypothetical protein
VKLVCPGHGDVFTDFHGAVGRTRKRIHKFMRDPSAIGYDILKKILVYTLMMKGRVQEEEFLHYLLTTVWFRETADFYFDGQYERVFSEIMNGFVQRGVVVRSNGGIGTPVEP